MFEPTGGASDGDILLALEEIQKKKPGWGNALAVLVFSVLIFVGAGSAVWSWRLVVLLLPILLFHELGHYTAMRLFRYHNVRMFFIPLFGAAVTGRRFAVAGWKRVLVSLAGPLPGIAAGAVIGIAGLLSKNPFLVKAAVMMLIVNAINLLPFLPLDGGWVVHTVLFSRHPLLDVAFRVLAVCAFVGAGALSRDVIFVVLGVFLGLGLPAAFRAAKVTANLRRQGFSPSLEEDGTISESAAEPVIHAVRAAFPSSVTATNLARVVFNILERLSTRPPGGLASVGLLALHACALIFAAVFIVLLVGLGHLAPGTNPA